MGARLRGHDVVSGTRCPNCRHSREGGYPRQLGTGMLTAIEGIRYEDEAVFMTKGLPPPGPLLIHTLLVCR